MIFVNKEKTELFCNFSRFTNYGSGPKRFPLQDVLQYALEFANSKPDPDTDDSTSDMPQIKIMESLDVEMESPKSQMR